MKGKKTYITAKPFDFGGGFRMVDSYDSYSGVFNIVFFTYHCEQKVVAHKPDQQERAVFYGRHCCPPLVQRKHSLEEGCKENSLRRHAYPLSGNDLLCQRTQLRIARCLLGLQFGRLNVGYRCHLKKKKKQKVSEHTSLMPR